MENLVRTPGPHNHTAREADDTSAVLFDDYGAAIFAYLGMALEDADAVEEVLVEVFRRAAHPAFWELTGLPEGVQLLEIARHCAAEHPLGSRERIVDLETGLAQRGPRRETATPRAERGSLGRRRRPRRNPHAWGRLVAAGRASRLSELSAGVGGTFRPPRNGTLPVIASR